MASGKGGKYGLREELGRHQQLQTEMRNRRKPTVIDLFCGCGGASLGFRNAGYELLCGIDLNSDALMTYQHNLGNAIKADVRHLPLRHGLRPCCVIAGPPCQGFSRMNRFRSNPTYQRQRNLLKWFAVAVKYLEPEMIMFENIPDVQRFPEFKAMVWMLEYDIAPVYCLNYEVLDAADYGVPQHRRRLILVGRKVPSHLTQMYEAPLPLVERYLTMDGFVMPKTRS